MASAIKVVRIDTCICKKTDRLFDTKIHTFLSGNPVSGDAAYTLVFGIFKFTIPWVRDNPFFDGNSLQRNYRKRAVVSSEVVGMPIVEMVRHYMWCTVNDAGILDDADIVDDVADYAGVGPT